MRVALNRVFCARRIDDIERRVCVCVRVSQAPFFSHRKI